MKPTNKPSRSTVGQGMNLATRYHAKAKGKASYSRKSKFSKDFE